MKSALRPLLILLVLIIPIVSPEIAVGILDSAHSQTNFEAAADVSAATVSPLSTRVFLNQTFESETTGAAPTNWTILYPQYGNIAVTSTAWYGSQPAAKCAAMIDNQTDENPVFYRFFPEQVDTIMVSIAIRPMHTVGVKKTLEFYVDDGNFNGACVIFQDGKIGYRTSLGTFTTLRSSYVADRWYKIDLLLNIRSNRYRIYIDDHLETASAESEFTGTCTQIHRIAFNETSGQDGENLPVAYIDEIIGMQGIEIPRDYPTIQEGINAAQEDDFILITKQRTYFESISIPIGKNSIWLIGEEMKTTIIDGSFSSPGSMIDGIIVYANHVRISALTIRSFRLGVGIHIKGSYTIIEDCNVANGMGDGIRLTGSNCTVTDTIVKSNLGCGVRILGSNCTLTEDIIESNDENGIVIKGSNSTIEDSIVESSFGCGLLIAEGTSNLARNNTFKKNGVGLKCDTNAKNNTIYQSRFINNTEQAISQDASNKWDDGYPFSLNNTTGGGNYWSDHSCTDVYSGSSQKEHAHCCLPDPDGICDEPYNLSESVRDNYPLFLVQEVNWPSEQNYGTPTAITATLLRFINIDKAQLQTLINSTNQNITMKVSGNILTGTIPGQKYGTQITFNITVHADSAETWVSTINYGPIRIVDKTPPKFLGSVPYIALNPSFPDTNQTFTATARVNDASPDASGIDHVSLIYTAFGVNWTATMESNGNDTYSATVSQQSQDGNMTLYVVAFDKAGNWNPTSRSVRINRLPELTVIYDNAVQQEPCNIDLGVMSRRTTNINLKLRFSNTGQEPMSWKIDLVKGGGWVWVNGTAASLNGTLTAGGSSVMNITVNTAGLEPSLYAAEYLVTTNGSIPSYVIVIRVTLRDIVIDGSFASCEAPNRTNVNTVQHYGFHAIWAHNSTDAISGKIKVKGIAQYLEANATGWVNFSDVSEVPASKTYYVEAVNFTYTKDGNVYYIYSFIQTSTNRTTIWDQVSVVLDIVDQRIDVGSTAIALWNNSVYKYDNEAFEGAIYLNDTLLHDAVGKCYITATHVLDSKYGLTAFESNVASCIWDRIRIIGGGASQHEALVGQSVTMWIAGIYEFDNCLFKGENGTLCIGVCEFNDQTQNFTQSIIDDPMEWSYDHDRWESTCVYGTAGTRRYNVSKVIDNVHGLTAIQDLAGPMDITWLTSGWNPWRTIHDAGPVPVQKDLIFPLWAAASIAATLALGIVATALVIIRSRKHRKMRAYDQHKTRNN